MAFVPSFRFLRKSLQAVPGNDGLKIEIPYDNFIDILRRFLVHVEVDEAWYLNTYPGVAAAVAAGEFKSAQDHFTRHGYFQGCWPRKFELDEVWYTKVYPGIGQAVATGDVRSAWDHFVESGYAEGRVPSDAVMREMYGDAAADEIAP